MMMTPRSGRIRFLRFVLLSIVIKKKTGSAV